MCPDVILVGDGVRFSMATRVVSKERYILVCQYVLVAALMATLVLAVAGVARLDIVGPHASSPTNQKVHTTSSTDTGR